MKPTPISSPDLAPLLAFGAHPDDIEFGCGGVIASETRAGRPVHMVICSRGEAGTHGTPEVRTQEAQKAAEILGATLEFLEMDGDAHLEIRASHVVRLAALIRRVKPVLVLAPTSVENQHPDHARLSRLIRDAACVARYGGISELKELPPHSIGQLFFYAISLKTEPRDITPIFVDVSHPQILATWQASMEAHHSQITARHYIELQLGRARQHGLNSGVEYSIALYPNDPIVVDSLQPVCRGARYF